MRLGLGFSLALLLAVMGIDNCMALTGKWRGDISLGPTKLPLVFNFSETPEGDTEATMDSPQQNAKGIPLEVKFCSQDSISLECKMIGATYNGRIEDGKIDGTFSQRGVNLPLTLTPEEDLSVRRPQTPQPPFPYIEKDIVFTSYDGTELAGTLTLPDATPGKKFPTVVMVTGSGPQNRDEEIFEHKPFAVIADYLARNGIASFRFDDRGTASSKGNYSEATIETFKGDARSAYNFVKGLPETDKTGILGHSEGGTLAVMIAAEDKPDFIISLAGMVIPSKETLLDQNIHLLDQLGISGKQKESSVKLIEKLYEEVIKQYNSGVSSPIDIDSICRTNSLEVPAIVLESVKQNNVSRTGYFDSLISLDPTSALKKLKCPVLAINGTKDIQVNADKNLEAFRNNVKNVEIQRMDGLNHLMQHAVTGETSEYNEIRETISPEVLSLISTFILRQK
ncbi:MAG: alpha/beta hydrolase [Muribaculaceae bacterium]|nr:alpha/beta hydrolase [Muribaculaceae bacterium]